MTEQPESARTDEEIALKVQNGDAESFGLLVSRYEGKIRRYGRRFLSDADDVKDIVQEIFIKAYVNIRSFDSSRRFSPWLYRIAHNELVNAIRKKSKAPLLPFEPDILFPHLIAKETADEGSLKKDLRRILDRHLKEIDAKYREPLVLYYFEEMDYKQIAEILTIPVSTVGVRLQRGKAMLKKMVGPNL